MLWSMKRSTWWMICDYIVLGGVCVISVLEVVRLNSFDMVLVLHTRCKCAGCFHVSSNPAEEFNA